MVQPTQYAGGNAPGQAVADPYDLLEGGKKAISFAFKDQNGYTQHHPVGTQFTGIIVGDLRSSQVIDFETKQPKFWPDNRPVMQVIMDLQTDMRDDEFDDGVRALYVKNQMLAAFQASLQATRHLGRIGEGTRVTVTLIGSKPSNKGNPQKIYQVDIGPEFVAYVPPEARQTQAALGYPAGAAPQQQWATPAQPQFPGQVVPAQPQAPHFAGTVPQQVPQQPLPFQPVREVASQQPLQQVQQYPEAIQPQGLPQQVQPQGVPQQQAQPSAALAAVNAIANQAPAAAPAAPPTAGITQEDVDSYHKLVAANIDSQTALTSLAMQLGHGPDYVAALAAAVGVQPPA